MKDMGVRFAVVAALVFAASVTVTGCSSSPTPEPLTPTLAATPTPTSTPLTQLLPAADSGPDRYATGTSTQTSPNSFSYTVAQGDTVLGIGGRFGVCYVDLYSANTNLDGHTSDLEVGQSLTVVRDNEIRHDPDLCLATDINYTG